MSRMGKGSCVLVDKKKLKNIPSLPSREQERVAAGVRLLMVGAKLHCQVLRLDDAPATWPS